MIAFLFSGQGSQKIGMGKDICEQYPAAKQVFEQASEALGFDMKHLVWEGSEEELMKTENTQPALLTVSTAIAAVLHEKGVKPDVTAGLSIGEYAALVESGALDFADGVRAVKMRGKYMQEEVPLGKGGMAAIIGAEPQQVMQLCEAASKKGMVECANFNCTGQIAIAGETEAVNYACEIAKQFGAKRAVPLAVSAPFHCRMLRGAGDKLKEVLDKIEYHDFKIDVITNVTAQRIPSKEDICGILVKQVSSAVKFEDSIKNMIAQGVDTFIEVGPGKALTGFVKKTSRDVQALNVEDLPSLAATLTALGKES